MLANYKWQRNPANPVLPPMPGSTCDSMRCMNPFVVKVDDEYRLHYSGGDDDGVHRICLATAPIEKPCEVTRHGVMLDIGETGAFDGRWCVLPCVRRPGASLRIAAHVVVVQARSRREDQRPCGGRHAES